VKCWFPGIDAASLEHDGEHLVRGANM
jgi:hypothetical protein